MSRMTVKIKSGKSFVFLDVPETATQAEIENYLINTLKVEFSPRFEIVENAIVREGLTIEDLRKGESEKVKKRRETKDPEPAPTTSAPAKRGRPRIDLPEDK